MTNQIQEENRSAQRSQIAWTAKVLLGDLLFWLEVCRRNLQRILSLPEIGRRFLLLKTAPDAADGRPGVLIINIGAAGIYGPKSRISDVTSEMGIGSGFVGRLLTQESYEKLLLPPDSDASAILARLANAPLPPAISASRAAIDVARGQRIVLADLRPKLQDAQHASVTQVARRFDRQLRRIYEQGHRSGFRHYEVWLYGITNAVERQGYLVLPANTLASADVSAASGPVVRVNARPQDTAGTVIRIVTWNIHSCVGLDGRYFPARTLSVIRRLGPDILALQEVDVRRKRSHGENQAQMFARALNMQAAFCRTVQRPQEEYGHVLLSRFPLTILKTGIINVPGGFEGEPRGALISKIAVGASEIYVLNTHLGLSASDRFQQAQALVGPEWLGLAPSGSPIIACGDFNTGPNSPPYRVMVSELRDAAAGPKISGTFPSPLPYSRIDHVFLSKHFNVLLAEVSQMITARSASDHLPLVIDVDLNPGGENC